MKPKKFLSALLAMVMVVAAVTFSSVKVDAYTSKSQSEAVAWIDAASGKYWDYDGAYGAQCVDLVMWYYSYLGVSPSGGNACDYIWNALPDGWSRIQYYEGFVAEPGDIAVFAGPSAYGHVALVSSANSTYMFIVENNHDGSGTQNANIYSYTYYDMSFWGVIRPDFAGAPSYTYTSIAPGVYYLKNNYNGKYLNVESSADINEQNISLADFSGSDGMKFEITATTTGYKMRPLCSTSRVVNAYGVTPGHGSNVNLFDDVNDSTEWWQFEEYNGNFIIHNVFAPRCVLDTDGQNVVIANWHGASCQQWTLEPVNHEHNKGEYMYDTSEHPHCSCYRCSICGMIWEDTADENINDSCDECNDGYEPYPVPGDVTGDYKVNLADVSLMLKYIAKWDVALSNKSYTADVTGDGKINLADVSLLLKYIAKWDVSLAG